MSLAIDSRIFGAHAAPQERLKFRSPLVIPVIDDFAFTGGITPVSNRNILLLAMPQPRHDYGKPLLWFAMVRGGISVNAVQVNGLVSAKESV